MRRFAEVCGQWGGGCLTQHEAARILGVSDRTFRRYIYRYEEEGLEGLYDKRSARASHRCAPVDEVCRVTELYRDRYRGWNVTHVYSVYRRRHGGGRSYTWVKNKLQEATLVAKAP